MGPESLLDLVRISLGRSQQAVIYEKFVLGVHQAERLLRNKRSAFFGGKNHLLMKLGVKKYTGRGTSFSVLGQVFPSSTSFSLKILFM